MNLAHDLDDKYQASSGQVFMNGTQALVRLPMAQMRRDRAAGLDTGAFITGYRGSPLGAYDQQLSRAKGFLDPLDIVFQPGVNEDLAATAIWGSQQVPLSRQARKQGVVGIWYGKGPGVDRCGDVFKHGNAAGSSQHGGVLCLAGDDHAAKSSTLPHQSDHAFMAAIMPMLYPSSVHEFIDVGLFGIAMSRYSGCWTGLKVISDTIETSAVVDLGDEHRPFVIPTDFEMPAAGLNLRWPDPPMIQDDRLQEQKAYAALAFARANKIDYTVIDSPRPRLGIVASGKAFEDVRQALIELGLTAQICSDVGLRLYKVRMPWPLEPEGIRHFSQGLEEVLVVEERREIIENQIKQQLFNWRADVRPRIVGKFDADDKHVLPLSMPLSASRVARAIAERVLKLELDESLQKHIRSRLEYLERRAAERLSHVAPIERQPWFCSGCPHNTSTKIPTGSTAMAGIGCHYMVQWMDRRTETFTQMGGEGVPWTAIAHFTDEPHRFVNLGDGTYFHSGLLAIRASKAAGVNITYKVLYNDAVAMTGGQDVDGELSPGIMTHQLHAEGISPIYLLSDEPEAHGPETLAAGVIVAHRDELDTVQRELRLLNGCNAIVYVQTCAAEKRRRRKRGLMVDPDRRVMINTAVCEGCGDCSVQSNCVSIEPLETPFGRKRRINQNTCNKDYSCVKGFCPSFVTIDGGRLRTRAAQSAGDASHLPEPRIPELGERPCNIAITGVGGTGVLTIGSIIGMAAHIDGKASMILDMAGLAQKGGAVLSHVRLAKTPEAVTSPHIVAGAADLLIAADDVVAASREGVILCDPERTEGIVNTTLTPVAAFVGQRDLDFRQQAVARTIGKHVASNKHFHGFASLAESLTGNTIATNIMMVGYAWQQGLIPLSLNSLQSAIRLNGVAIEANLDAFLWGRRLSAEPSVVLALVEPPATAVDARSPAEMTLAELIEHRSAHLVAYQDEALASRYRVAVARMDERARSLGLDDSLARAVAVSYPKLLAPKDEFEVARLYSTPEFRAQLAEQFEGDIRLSLNLAPPFLPGTDSAGRPKKRAFGPWVFRALDILARGKHWRPSVFNPFRWSAERREERAWLERYESDLERAHNELSAETQAVALDILSLPQEIRGYGPVKEQAMKDALQSHVQLWSDFDRPAPVDAGRAAA